MLDCFVPAMPAKTLKNSTQRVAVAGWNADTTSESFGFRGCESLLFFCDLSFENRTPRCLKLDSGQYSLYFN